MSRAYRDRGIVLRTHRLGETDRILTLLLQGRGKVRAVAKGVRRPGSRIGGRVEPFSHVDLELHEGRSLDIVRQVETIDAHDSLRVDDRLHAAASVMVELVDVVAAEGQRDQALLRQLQAGLAALEADPDSASVFVDAFLLRATSIVGFPVLTGACARCRAPGPHARLSVVGGGTLCDDCGGDGTRQVGSDVIEAVRLLGDDGSWQALPALAREHPEARATAGSYARAFVEHHLDRRLRSYDALERG
ncbi:MAG: DNA repair protein RecO [Actinomycetota bacterium]|nr:DNA repair protein RecO [Actinomycetota bacterium]